jgi:hypothetical protein
MLKYAVLSLIFIAAPASADEILVVKAGEWVHTMSMDGNAMGAPMKSCAKKDRMLTDAALGKMIPGASCTFTHSRAGGVVTVNAVCVMGAMKMSTVETLTPISDDEYTMSSTSHIDNPPKGMPSEMKMAMHWTHTGPCQPGDRAMPNQ